MAAVPARAGRVAAAAHCVTLPQCKCWCQCSVAITRPNRAHLHEQVVVAPPEVLQLVVQPVDDALLPVQLRQHALQHIVNLAALTMLHFERRSPQRHVVLEPPSSRWPQTSGSELCGGSVGGVGHPRGPVSAPNKPASTRCAPGRVGPPPGTAASRQPPHRPSAPTSAPAPPCAITHKLVKRAAASVFVNHISS